MHTCVMTVHITITYASLQIFEDTYLNSMSASGDATILSMDNVDCRVKVTLTRHAPEKLSEKVTIA